jgi:hypothetical protein
MATNKVLLTVCELPPLCDHIPTKGGGHTRLELFFEDAVLLDQVRDQLRLTPIDPACEGRQEKSKMDGFDHPGSVSEKSQPFLWHRDRILRP